jgi:hypothetical protein
VNRLPAVKIRLVPVLLAAVALLASGVAHARVAVPDILSDGMVLQRDAKVPLWGTAEPGEVVTVRRTLCRSRLPFATHSTTTRDTRT